MSKTIIGILMLSLCGCATSYDDGMPPPDVKPIILANKSRIFKDPESVRDASITPPFRNAMFSTSWLVCVRANAKNSFGGFTGTSDMLIAIRGTEPNVLYDNARGACEPQPHEPFPELEGKIRKR